MSAVGFDFGNLNSVIAVARNRGVDVICNEVSNRATPTLVSFGPKNRYIGESAKTQEVSNFKNTTFSIKKLLGSHIKDMDLQHETKFLSNGVVEAEGSVGYPVNYQGENHIFSSIEVAAMVLRKLKEITEVEVQRPVTEVVISVPQYYTDRQRRAMLDAAAIANLKCLRLINETTAVALNWGMSRVELPAENDSPVIVCFVDIGHASTQVAVTEFTQSRLDVRGTAFDRHLGGRDYDDILAQHFCNELMSSHRNLPDIRLNKRAMFRLSNACERVKKILSANAFTRLNVEALIEDIDVSADIKRETFEELTKNLTSRIEAVVREALSRAKVEISQVHHIEIVGGTTRIPSIKALLSSLFCREVSTTLNQDEAVARGAAMQAAILSPQFRVREYSIHDVVMTPVKFAWQPTETSPDDRECLVFPAGNSVPSTKVLSFEQRALPFEIECEYAESTLLPSIEHSHIGTASIFSPESSSSNDMTTKVSQSLNDVKVKVRVNPNGLFNVEGAHFAGKDDIKFPITFKPKASLSHERLQELRDHEAEMHAIDKLIAETADKRNSLEEYIYEMRAKLDDSSLSCFISKEDSTKLAQLMTETEKWLYDGDGVDATKGVYASRLDQLCTLGQPMKDRIRESEQRPQAEQRLRDLLRQLTAETTSGSSFAFAEQADKDLLHKELQSKTKWLEEQLGIQNSKPLYVKPTLTASMINNQFDGLKKLADNIRSKSAKAAAMATKKVEEAAKAAAAASSNLPKCNNDACCDESCDYKGNTPCNIDDHCHQCTEELAQASTVPTMDID